ncbi:MAG: glycosyltransferase [bacterium]|nr:MAG: glycosyltransferase [bacterium]
MNLSIIIVTHNSSSPVVECLASLREHPPSRAFETIIIDNASSDGTPRIVEERFPEVRVIANTDNRGYSRGVNQGIEQSSGTFILILNPDIILTDGAVDRLIELMEKRPDAGITASKLIYPDGRLQYSCRTFYNLKVLLLRRTFLGRLFPNAKSLRRHLMKDYDHEQVRVVDWVLGACMMVRREAIERVGKMDERFFLYFEDIDWCFRMKNQGWSVYYLPDSVMIHSYERSSARSVLNRPFMIHMLSMLRYYEKWNQFFYFFRRHRTALKATALVLSDIIAINVGFFAAYYLRDLLQPFFVNRLYPIDWYRSFIIFSNFIYFLTLLFSGLYRVRRETPRVEGFLRLSRAVFIGLVILMASTYLTRVRIFSRAVLIGHAGLTVLAVTCFRQIIRRLHRELVKASFDLKRVLLVGTGGEVQSLARRLSESPEMGFDIVGSISDAPDSLGTVHDLVDVVERFKVQEVILFPSSLGEEQILPVLIQLKERMIQIRIVSPLARIIGTNVRIEELEGLHLFSVERGAFLLARRCIKRLGDILIAVLSLPFVLLLCAVYFMYGTITGQVRFYGEIRLGKGGRRFAWPRAITGRGREASDCVKIRLLFQLLAGTLSLVGPPALHPSWDVSDAASELLETRPGITGRWRIMMFGDHSTALSDEALELHQWSLTREMMVLIQSIPAILSGRYPTWYFENGRDT